ncbi:MAG TPA: right-handed parallel beta-helix repeat-containing protein, partial [Tepidisphaeraceae bacterium]
MTTTPHFGVQLLEPRRLLSTIYVDANAPAPHDGTSWGSAYLRLTTALNNAVSGDTIHVAGGTYYPTTGTNQAATFQLIDGVSIFGGYAGYRSANPDARNIIGNPTVLSGDIAGTGSSESYHIVTGSGTDSTAVLDGFTIRDGSASASGVGDPGAGIKNVSGSPTVRNCTFTNDEAAAIGNSANSSPTITNCTFSSNKGTYASGGINNDHSNPIVSECTFVNNNTENNFGGGAMWNINSSPTVTDCRFLANEAIGPVGAARGGAVYNDTSSANFTNCLFVGNTSVGLGGAIDSTGTATVTCINCTFYENGNPISGSDMPGAFYGGAIDDQDATTILTNCILWHDFATTGPEIHHSGGGGVNVSYSDVEGGAIGTGDIDAAPHFVTPGVPGPDGKYLGSDQRLLSGSPCVDDGDNSAVPAGIVRDLEGASRFFDVPGVHDPGAIVDMGAYERPNLVLSPVGSYQIGLNPLLTIHFNEPINPASLNVNDLVLDRPGSVPLNTSFFSQLSYNAKSLTATWTFIRPLPDDNYNAILPAGSVLDQFDYPTETDSVTPFFFLGGDANQDRKVDATDLGILSLNWQQSGRSYSQGNFNLSPDG